MIEHADFFCTFLPVSLAPANGHEEVAEVMEVLQPASFLFGLARANWPRAALHSLRLAPANHPLHLQFSVCNKCHRYNKNGAPHTTTLLG